MTFARNRGWRFAFVLALLLSVGSLLGASAVHVHDDHAAQGQCAVCRWAQETAPVLAVAFVLLLSLPETGTIIAAARPAHSVARPRRAPARAPPLV